MGCGGWFEFAGKHAVRRIAEHRLPGPPWHWIDDTQMALAISAILQQYEGIDQDALAATLATRYERSRGYGMATRAVLARVRSGATAISPRTHYLA
ncbi:MAG: ADP-ribosylglycohydrolase family protein [Oscillochloris sp.]|nr:ADP-ribosylglycohydrolase family protein [Oscillochloris sp.]